MKEKPGVRANLLPHPGKIELTYASYSSLSNLSGEIHLRVRRMTTTKLSNPLRGGKRINPRPQRDVGRFGEVLYLDFKHVHSSGQTAAEVVLTGISLLQ